MKMINLEERENLLIDWLNKNIVTAFHMQPIQNDASFRRYFRVKLQNKSLIAMDAPPERENLTPYIAVAKAFAKKQLCVPDILACNQELGFMLLTDLGDDQYLRILTSQNVAKLYQCAMTNLLELQDCQDFMSWQLPMYNDDLLCHEMELFRTWYLEKRLSLKLTQAEHDLIDEVFMILVCSANAQPKVCVHRDYHSRNLLQLPDDNVGILDFQDAVRGPITYDLVSLLRDCYIAWPQSFVKEQVNHYRQLVERKHATVFDRHEFQQWFDWLGLQRHLKVLGIFVRLFLRDGKEIYLTDLPRVMSYVLYVVQHYSIFKDFLRFLQLRVFPNESHDFSCRTREAYATLNR